MKDEDLEWKNVTIANDIEKKVREEKGRPGKNLILYGGCGLVTSFAKLDLIDEYYLMTVPVILGEGKHLFEGVNKKVLKLVESKASVSGVIINHYQRK